MRKRPLLSRRGIMLGCHSMVSFLNPLGVVLRTIPGGVAYGPSWQLLVSIGLLGLRALVSCLSDANVVL